MVVALARTGDDDAFADLVSRRQSWIRNLMRRLAGDITLADDLAQQVFLQAWRNIDKLAHTASFGAWLKRLAINEWLQHARRHDVLHDNDELDAVPGPRVDPGSTDTDLNKALATLGAAERLCIVLAYHEDMTHLEISEATNLPLGTVKSHLRRGTQKLQQRLEAYRPGTTSGETG